MPLTISCIFATENLNKIRQASKLFLGSEGGVLFRDLMLNNTPS